MAQANHVLHQWIVEACAVRDRHRSPVADTLNNMICVAAAVRDERRQLNLAVDDAVNPFRIIAVEHPK